MRKCFLIAILAFSACISNAAHAITLNTGDTLRIDFAIDPATYSSSGNKIITDFGVLGVGESFLYELFSADGLMISQSVAGIGTAGSMQVSGELGPLNLYATLTNIVGSVDILSSTFFGGGTRAAGTFTLTSSSAVPIPATLPLLATALGALGFAGFRRKSAGAGTA
jgi:hypothetical protein